MSKIRQKRNLYNHIWYYTLAQKRLVTVTNYCHSQLNYPFGIYYKIFPYISSLILSALPVSLYTFFPFILASVYLVLSSNVFCNIFLIFLNVFLSFLSCRTDTKMIDSPEVLTPESCLPNTKRSRPLSRTIENTCDWHANTNKCKLPPKALAGECLHSNIKVSFFPVVDMFLLFSFSC